MGLGQDSLEAWCLDGAVASFGQSLEAALDLGSEKAKNKKQAQQQQMRVLLKWLPEAGGPKFRDPAAR